MKETLVNVIGTGNSPRILQQGKANVIPTETCQNWYYDRWRELLPYKLSYQAPIDGDDHICVGKQSTIGHVSSCYVRERCCRFKQVPKCCQSECIIILATDINAFKGTMYGSTP